MRHTRNNHGFLALMGSLAILCVAMGCGGRSSEIRSAFQEAAPQPEWWDRIDAKEARTYNELLAYWQDNDRTPNQFFKAAYQAVLDHPQDDDIVVLAVNLMPYGDTAYPHTVTMLEFAIDYYFEYDRPLNNYGGKSGDSIAGIVEKLAKIYNRAGNHGAAVVVIERLIDTREHEVNDQMLELVSLQYAEALHGYGRTAEAIAWLDAAIEKYHGDWEKRLSEKRALLSGY